MRILFTILLSALIHSGKAQAHQDSLNMLQSRAKHYLQKMYVEKDMNGLKMWGTTMLSEAIRIYSKIDSKYSNDSLLLIEIKKDFGKYYADHTGFKLVEVNKETLDYQGGSIIYTISYMYSEKYKNKKDNWVEICNLIYDEIASEWKVMDTKGLSIMSNATQK